mgnify:CR=1 FL=1
MEALKVVLALANWRMGGQLSGLLALREQLQRAGIAVDIVPKDCLADKRSVEVLARGSLIARMMDFSLSLLRINGMETVLHLVVPSPAFSWMAALAGVPTRHVLVQYEGPCIGARQVEVRELIQDLQFLFPRVVLNAPFLSWPGRYLSCTHLATYPALGEQLRQLGFKQIEVIGNLSRLGEEDWGKEFECSAIAPELRRIGYIGHGHPVKGVADLVYAFSLAAQRCPDLRLCLALSGERDSRPIVRLVERLGIAKLVDVKGVVPVASFLERIDALVLPYRSAWTTTMYPSLMLEAERARCPMIISSLPEFAEVLKVNSSSLRLVEPRNVEGLAAALEAVRKRCALEFQPYLSVQPDSVIVDRIVQLYRRILAAG